jgi:hypothetical protein
LTYLRPFHSAPIIAHVVTAAADAPGCFTPAKITKRTPNEAADFGRRLSGTAFAHPWHADKFKERKEL